MLYKKKFLISFLTLLTLIVVIGSGFAVWNFDTEDDSSKGIYNLGLYVTPNVESLGTVSLNNDYAMILDQGDLDGIVTNDLEHDLNYYRRGISIVELKPDPDNPGNFLTKDDGSYDYDPVKQLTAVYVAAQEDTQKILTENINDMRFLTKIRLRKKLATYVQVRPNDSYAGTQDENNTIFGVQDPLKESLLEDEYVEYLYEWGNLSDVLRIENGEFHTEWKKGEVCDIVRDKTTDFYNNYCNDTDASKNSWRDEEKDDFLAMANYDILPDGFKLNPTGIYKTSELGLYLIPCRGIKTYTVYDKTAGQIVGFFNNNDAANTFVTDKTSAQGGYQGHDLVVTLAYYKYYKKEYLTASEQDINLKPDLFTNEVPQGSTDYSSDNDERLGNLGSSGSRLTVGSEGSSYEFDVFDCYTFTYLLNVATYDGKEGNEPAEGAYAHENARFIYYPCSQTQLGDEMPNEFKDHEDQFVLNTLKNAYYGDGRENSSFKFLKKPTTVGDYEDMLKSFEISDKSTGQFVDLEMRYVIVDFTSELITKASDETNSVSPTV